MLTRGTGSDFAFCRDNKSVRDKIRLVFISGFFQEKTSYFCIEYPRKGLAIGIRIFVFYLIITGSFAK